MNQEANEKPFARGLGGVNEVGHVAEPACQLPHMHAWLRRGLGLGGVDEVGHVAEPGILQGTGVHIVVSVGLEPWAPLLACRRASFVCGRACRCACQSRCPGVGMGIGVRVRRDAVAVIGMHHTCACA